MILTLLSTEVEATNVEDEDILVFKTIRTIRSEKRGLNMGIVGCR
jgi:hypothetical protein